LTLVLGGARSGKSRFAENLVMTAPPPWSYIATAQALDAEMAERIAAHARRRGSQWSTREVPLDLAGAIAAEGSQAGPLLVDCLTLWLSNVMLAGRPAETEIDELLSSLASVKGPLIVVSNEVGLGIVPDNRLARAFRDAQGRLNAEVAELANHVVFIAAGLPLTLKQS
jgi:adenosylcobinamide kinase/adenosylcobinamide-phosphate guanylyltransferase